MAAVSTTVSSSIDLAVTTGTGGTLTFFDPSTSSFILVPINFNNVVREVTDVTTSTKTIDGGHLFASWNELTVTTQTHVDQVIVDVDSETTVASNVTSTTSFTEQFQSGGELDPLYHSFSAADVAAQTGANRYAPTSITGAGEGADVRVGDVIDYTPRMITQTITTGDAAMLTVRDLFPDPATRPAGLNPNHIVYNTEFLDADGLIANPAYTQGQDPTAANFKLGAIEGIAIVRDYGLLQDLGLQDNQNLNNDEFFIGSVNPGVAPTNGFFAVFGQFFDHGLDFIDKSGKNDAGQTAKIKIALAVDDPLYGAIGPDGRPTTEITITRATPAGLDANGDVRYINHTSPFVDQSQSYGSSNQIEALLREWVEDPNNPGTYIPGTDLVDSYTLDNQWTRWDGVETNQTLVTINTLRQHIRETGRDDLSWEDIGNVRNRDANGKLIDSDGNAGNGIQTTGSGHALLLDMNPRFDAKRLDSTDLINSNSTQTVADVVDAAIATLNTILQTAGPGATSLGTLSQDANGLLTLNLVAGATGPGSPAQTFTGASAMAPFVNFADFSIQTTLFGQPGMAAVDHDAVSDILVASVGDHYLSGDGRVNENAALTSIHHVFHEEHNYQVQNIQTWVLAQDIEQSTGPTDHPVAVDWMTAITNTATAITNANVAVVGGHYEATGGLLATDVKGDVYVVPVGTTTASDPNFVDFVRTPPVVDAAGNQQLGTAISATGYFTDANGYLSWNQDKMFEAVKLVVETEYNHVATDQFAGAVTPDIPEFVGYNSGRDASITLEFGQNAYRYGHSTLRETIDVLDPDGGLTSRVMSYALEAAFLNPELFASAGPDGLILGQTRQQMNEIDEIITPALQQGLLGLPLDLASINIARGRDVGLPTFNEMRVALGFGAYNSWSDYGANMVHPESLVKFIAAYSFDGDVAHAQAIMDAANGAATAADLFNNFTKGDGSSFTDTADAATYASNFMSGSLDAANRAGDNDKAIDLVDAWMGGIAEVHVNGGLLGETFNAIFVDQITALKDGDRFYYLYRLFGQEIDEQIKAEQFKDLVERTTGTTNLNGNIFGYAEEYSDLSLDAAWPSGVYLYNADGDVMVQPGEFFDPGVTYYTQGGVANGATVLSAIPTAVDLYSAAGGVLVAAGSVPTAGIIYYDANGSFIGADQHKYGQILAANAGVANGQNAFDGSANIGLGVFSDAGGSTAANGEIITVDGVQYIQDLRVSVAPGGRRNNDNLDGEPGSGPDAHEVITGTDFNDVIFARAGDDTVYGQKGNDLIFGGNGADALYGGEGHDTIYGGDGPEVTDGGAGDDLIFGDSSESAAGGVDLLIGGLGNDTIYGGVGIDELIGNGGDDVMFGGGDTDPFTRAGDGNDYVDGGAVGDNLYGDAGDDLIVGGDDQDIVQGGEGDDILRPGRPSQALGGGPDEILGGDGFRDNGFDIVEFNDWDPGPTGVDTDLNQQANPLLAVDGITPNAAMTQVEGVIGTQNDDNLIGDSFRGADHEAGPSNGSNWLIGGTGNDSFTGNGGNDVIIGGSIRLDSLIGQYQATAGAAGARSAYNDYNAYVGASHRVTDGSVLSDGLLGNAAIGTEMFDLHFTEFLKSDMFKDYVLGNAEVVFDPLNIDDPNAGNAPGDPHVPWSGVAADDSASTDIANFSGLRSDYTITAIPFTDAQGNNITAYKVVDNRPADLITGILVNGDGIATSDGTDLLIGIEQMVFADITLNSNQFGNTPATGAAVINGFATANVQGFAPTVFPFGPLTVDTATIADADGLGALSLQWQSSPDGVTWTDIVGATGNSYQPVAADLGLQLRAVVSFTDGQGLPEMVISAPTDFVGEYLLDAPGQVAGELQGDIGQDILIGRAGNDQLQGGDGNDWLNGGAGADQMQGGVGDDTYIVDNIGDVVNEGNNNGIDEVRSRIDWTLGANIENLRLIGGNPTNGTGNALDNRILGNNADNIIAGGGGNDTINARRGSDTIEWNTGDGRDVVNGGGGGNVALGIDTFAVTGDATAEVFNIYAISGGSNAAQRANLINQFGPFAPGTEIVISYGSGVAETVIAELNNIEEITVNTSDAPSSAGTTTQGGDIINVLGNFAPTSLLLNTITIQGSAGDDTVDIRGLASDHRIVFQSNGGVDTIVGDLRPQDVIEVVGPSSGYSAVVNADGSQTLSDGANAITVSATSVARITDSNGEEVSFADGVPTDAPGGSGTSGDTPPPASETADILYGTAADDNLIGSNGDDLVLAQAGNDRIFGGSGADDLFGDDDNDVIYGNAGNDRIFGGEGVDLLDGGNGADIIFGDDGNDIIYGKAGSDMAWGGDGNDLFRASLGDGNDWYYGGAGADTLDLSDVLADVSVDLNIGANGFGSASSSETGNDMLSGIENAIGGAGDDTFIASEAVNLLTGGAGNDTFRFDSAAKADGDVITDFSAGDKIDLSMIGADFGGENDTGFELLDHGEFTATGQVRIRVDEEGNSVIEGNTDGDLDTIEFSIEVVGVTDLNKTDFSGVM